HEQPSLRIVGEGVRAHEFARRRALLSVRADELAVLRISHEAITTLLVWGTRLMTVGDDDVAIRRADAGRWPHERVFPRLLDARLAHRHEQLAIRTELVNHIAFFQGIRIGRATEWPAITRPEVSILIAAERMNGSKHTVGHGLDDVA